ncbi:MAG TPA: hypothetical protein VFR93_01180 [Candidatus Limnocylindrales bacterium]|jgi:hypothetical protein|nr:hypothetical protein [Candidatus Limnocylindrales bacterium]
MTGRIRPGEFESVTASIRSGYADVARSTAGLDRFVVATRPHHDGGDVIAMVTIWADLDAAVTALGGDLTGLRTIDGRDHGANLERVDYYELEELRTRDGDAEPGLLRLTAGTVARGLDADMQQELRGRLGDLPDEALEAYVGRRVLGRLVEIAFVSTWSRQPETLRLEEPIWPWISDRYEAFRMDVLEVFLSGVGRAAIRP